MLKVVTQSSAAEAMSAAELPKVSSLFLNFPMCRGRDMRATLPDCDGGQRPVNLRLLKSVVNIFVLCLFWMSSTSLKFPEVNRRC